MKYLLDTDTLIDFLQDRGATRKRITALIDADEEVAVCAITVAEVFSGLSEKNASSGVTGSFPFRIGTSH
jgi:predicted nucleic acid-binding protein